MIQKLTDVPKSHISWHWRSNIENPLHDSSDHGIFHPEWVILHGNVIGNPRFIPLYCIVPQPLSEQIGQKIYNVSYVGAHTVPPIILLKKFPNIKMTLVFTMCFHSPSLFQEPHRSCRETLLGCSLPDSFTPKSLSLGNSG